MFEGFTQQSLDFLLDIRFNNHRDWFNGHKEIYRQSLLTPMRELSDELYAFVIAKRPDYGLIHKVSRIYKDARRLHGGGPYRDHMWLGIEPPSKEWADIPSLWFSLSWDGWSYGLSYPARPAAMERLRKRIQARPGEMRQLMERLSAQQELALQTTDYKRPRPGAPDEGLEVWFRARRFWLEHEQGHGQELFSRAVAERVKGGFEFLLPFVDYFMTL